MRRSPAVVGLVIALAVVGCQRGGSGTLTTAASPSAAKTPPASASASPAKVRMQALAATTSSLWVLGTTSCTARACPGHLYRSRDNGQHWQQLVLPRSVTISSGDSSTPGVTDVAFANGDHDGWLYGPDLWSTHDGGASWRRLRLGGAITAVRLTTSTVWAVAQSCPTGRPCRFRVLRAATGSDQLHQVRLPQPSSANGAPPSITTNGPVVAALVSGTPNTRHDADQLDLSADEGRTWTRRTGPCLDELGGSLAVAAGTVWAACPTGMQAGIAVSHGAGAFREQQGPWQGLPNSAGVAAGSGTVLVTSVGRAYVSRDGAGSWSPARVETPAWQTLADVSFPRAGDGYALVVAPTVTWLVHSTDGGSKWRRLTAPR